MGPMVRKVWIGIGGPLAVAALALGQAATASAAVAAPVGATATLNCSATYVPPPSSVTLTLRSTGKYVTALQQRLTCLHYWVGGIDGKFGPDTLFAVWAFKEVQAGRYAPANPDVVDAATQRQLVSPKTPPVRHPGGGATRIEVNKTLQVLVLYKNGKPWLISHVSTARHCLPGQGCQWYTPNGRYHAEAFMPGWVTVPLGRMYNPVFFIRLVYAIHGDSNPAYPTDLSGVALVPASHGCVRMPLDLAKTFHTYLKIASGTAGTPVFIDGPKYQ